MSVDLNEPAFPVIVTSVLQTFIELLDDTFTVLLRPLRTTDPNLSVGIYSTIWSPTPGSAEFTGLSGLSPAALERYVIIIQAMVKDADAERGAISHSVLSEAIRTMLDSDPSLRIELGGLSATVGGRTKSLKRWWPVNTRFFSSELDGNQLYLSVNEMMIEVERT